MKKSKLLILLLIFCFTLSLGFLNSSMVTAGDEAEIYNLKTATRTASAVVSWNTDASFYSEIYYGESEDYGAKIKGYKVTDWHVYEITGLTSGTTYYYRAVIKDRYGKELDDKTGSFSTGGTQPASRVFKPYFYLNFNGNLYSQNNQFPTELYKPNGFKFVEPSIWQGALEVQDSGSYAKYSVEKMFNAGYGTVMVWVRIESFSRDMTIWETNDQRYGLYFEAGRTYSKIIARAGYDSDDDKGQEAIYFIKTSGTGADVWRSGVWHHLAMVWQGKLSGTVKLYFDGEKRAEGHYSNGGGASTFMVGNNYSHNEPWRYGQIDDFKMYDWDLGSTDVRNEYRWLNLNQEKDVIKGQVAGYTLRYFKDGKLIKVYDWPEIYVLSHGQRIHISDLSAMDRLQGWDRVNLVTQDELDQYPDGGTFYTWSRFPDGTMLKGMDKTVYWVWDGEKRAIANETVFHRYQNDWFDIVNVSESELGSYTTGFTYY